MLLATSFVVAGLLGFAFLLYKKELGSACETARRGSLVANTGAGPIEYAEKGMAFRCCQSMARAAVSIRVSPMRPNLWMTAFEASHLPASDIYARPFREMPLPRRKLMRMQRFSPT
jgi:hypothetical protein